MTETHWRDAHPGGGGDAQRDGDPQPHIEPAEMQQSANHPRVAESAEEQAEVNAEHPGNKDDHCIDA